LISFCQDRKLTRWFDGYAARIPVLRATLPSHPANTKSRLNSNRPVTSTSSRKANASTRKVRAAISSVSVVPLSADDQPRPLGASLLLTADEQWSRVQSLYRLQDRRSPDPTPMIREGEAVVEKARAMYTKAPQPSGQ